MHVMCGCMCMYVEEVGAVKRGTECESDGGKDREHFYILILNVAS